MWLVFTGESGIKVDKLNVGFLELVVVCCESEWERLVFGDYRGGIEVFFDIVIFERKICNV